MSGPEILRHHTIAPHLMRLVILESPYRGTALGPLLGEQLAENLAYARACVLDSLKRGEAPIASHLLYTQPGLLDDSDRNERAHGINAGHAWIRVADALVVYTDRGISEGMRAGMNSAESNGLPVELRNL